MEMTRDGMKEGQDHTRRKEERRTREKGKADSGEFGCVLVLGWCERDTSFTSRVPIRTPEYLSARWP